MISAEEKTSVTAVLSFGDQNTRGGTVEVLFVFIVQRKILLLFQNFEVKIHLKLFFKSDFHKKKRYFAKQNKARIANKWAQGSNFIDRMVISQRRDFMDYLQKLEMVIYWEKATLKAINSILPNKFEFQLCLLLQKI